MLDKKLVLTNDITTQNDDSLLLYAVGKRIYHMIWYTKYFSILY